jgi:hypothetical protein
MPLQKFALFSALFTIEVHLERPPTLAGGHPARFWMLLSNSYACCTTEAASGYSCWHDVQISAMLAPLPRRSGIPLLGYPPVGGRSVKSLLAFASIVIPGVSHLEIHDQDFFSLLEMYVFRNGASSSMREGLVFLCRRYVCCTVVSTRVYPRCRNVQATVDCVDPLSLQYYIQVPVQSSPANSCWPSHSRSGVRAANWPCIYHFGTDRVENISAIIAVLSCCRGNMLVCWAVT